MVEPMTAAEYRESWPNSIERDINGAPRALAALEEREALLGERAGVESERALGALVRRIREHPMLAGGPTFDFYTHGHKSQQWIGVVSEEGFREALSHLDSLLPKEPEVVAGPSGWKYKRSKLRDVAQLRNDEDGGNWMAYDADDDNIPPCDAPVVAKLMENSQGGSK